MTSTNRKPDEAEILEFLRDLRDRPFLRYGSKSRWSHFVFHYASLENACKILHRGKIYSRNRLAELELDYQECAAPDVIEGTQTWVQDYVRFYFRPRTPTQYHMEGIRPRDQRRMDAHCPMPIFFAMDIDEILAREGTEFSEGNLGSFNPVIGDSVRELRELPFEDIYHDGYYDTQAFPRRTYHKNAEVIIPQEVDVADVRNIYCRSDAEKQTLLQSLSIAVRDRWEPYIYHDPSINLYYNHWSFVEEAYSLLGYIAIRFNPETRTPGPFHLTQIVSSPDTGEIWTGETSEFIANDVLHLSIDELRDHIGTCDIMDLTIQLDGETAYKTRIPSPDR